MFTFYVYKRLNPKRCFKGYSRLYGSGCSHIQNILFALEENTIHECSKPEDPSMESKPHRFGLPIGNPHRHCQKEEATSHMQTRRAPRMATVHDTVKETNKAHLIIVHAFHTYASTDTLWVAHGLSRCIPVRYGRIASISAAHHATQFGHSICPICVNTFQMLVHSDPTNVGLNRHRRGLPPWSSEFTIQSTLKLPIQYSPFPSNFPTRSPIMLTIRSSC
jgi:hypothetical protein